MKSVIIIPARLASTRLPRKLLLSESGKSLLEHTYQSASKSKKASSVIVAADDPEIVDVVESFGGKVVMTDPNHTCGTDRVAEVAATMTDVDIIINVQGDEPEISADAIDLAIQILEDNDAPMSTLATPIRTRQLLESKSCVKVVVGNDDRAIYFSRSPIPCARDWKDELLTGDPPAFLQHVGLYGYQKDFLAKITTLRVPLIEQVESLEQLRILSAGFDILVGMIDHPITGIDTAEDYAAFVNRVTN